MEGERERNESRIYWSQLFVTVMTAEILLKRGHEVVIVERNKERINELSKDLD